MKTIILICVLAFALADEDDFDTFNCLPMPETGMCKGYFEMYYYDYQSRSCKTFVYGGCGGNLNKFPTEKECMEKCGDVTVSGAESVCDLPSEVGECRAAFPRFYFDKETGRCRKFIYGGCGGNGNNFSTEKECNQRCGRMSIESAPPAFCNLEKETGPCKAGFRRFYFNKDTGKCEQFLYGGCLGNLNNFPSEKECEAICK